MNPATILITGASGFIGTHLVQYFVDRGYQLIALSRKQCQRSSFPQVQWVQHFSQIQTRQIDYVINLAGENIGQSRWSDHRKQKLIQSRVETTKALYEWLNQQQIYPKSIISGSAVGYYGIDETEQWSHHCVENSPSQQIFMSELCQLWERTALSYEKQHTKIIRLGVVFAMDGGILPQMLFPIRWNLVDKIGSGRQPVVWIHIQDVLSAIEFIMKSQTEDQIYNLVAPQKISQIDFSHTAAKVLGRKPLLAIPKWVFRLMLGEQSQLILNGQYVAPKNLLKEGFKFHYPTLELALRHLLKR